MDCLRIETTANGITTITLNRPDKRNAMNQALIKALLQAVHQTAEDAATRILMIHGAGDHFCAGADISWMQKIATASYEENVDDAECLADLLFQLYHYPKPTIVLAQGATMGGGLGLLSVCDIALASENAVFGFSEVKIGLAPSTISPYVIGAIGARAAQYYFLTGERFDANRALQLQLIHKIASHDLMQDGLNVANTLLQNAPLAMSAIKQLIRRVKHENITEDLAQKTAEHLAHLRASEEAQEGLKAFLEKRQPHWIREI